MTAKTQSSKSTANTTPKKEFKGMPEADAKGIYPKSKRQPVKKLTPSSLTPWDKAQLGLVLGYVGMTGISTAVGAWYAWGDDWMNIAHLYWPLGIATLATGFIVVYRFSRE